MQGASRELLLPPPPQAESKHPAIINIAAKQNWKAEKCAAMRALDSRISENSAAQSGAQNNNH
jgi:hypothetical protein